MISKFIVASLADSISLALANTAQQLASNAQQAVSNAQNAGN